MSSQDTPTSDSIENGALRDLQSLLRKSIGEEVVVLDYKTTSLLPAGENYGSSMLKVDAVIRKSKDSPEEEKLYLVAKMVPLTEFQKSYMNIAESFKKEIFVFEKLIEAYRTIEKESGVADESLFDVLPKFYGGRLSLTNDVEADENAVMLMENLKFRGHYNVDRLKGVDLEHSLVAIKALARFHALGTALKYKKPNLFEEVRKSLDILPFDLENTSVFDEMTHHNIDIICNDPRIAKYADKVRQCKTMKWTYLKHLETVEPWITIAHGDFWSNNILFHKGENGKIDDVKFVDFQITRSASPMFDLPYFLCANMSIEVQDNHFEEMIDAYYHSFIAVLEQMGCDTSLFSRRSFDEQLKKDAKTELFRCLMALKFFTTERSSDLDINDMQSQVLFSSGNNLYLERSWKVVSKFAEKDWL